MSCLVLSAAVCAVTGATDPEPAVVHEWGVVRYAEGTVLATGSPGWSQYGSVCVDAPVIMFHGAPFTGDVTVCSTGRITSIYPEPDVSGGPMLGLDGAGLGSMARWEGLSVSPSSPDDSSDDIPVDRDRAAALDFYWAMDGWRLPGSSTVFRAGDSFSDSFLYYEVDLSGQGFPVPLESLRPEGTPREELAEEMLLFVRDEYGTVVLSHGGTDGIVAEDETILAPTDSRGSGDAIETVARWAGDHLTDEEIRSMWITWEPYILYGDWQGSTLAVFPIPDPLVERISMIIVAPDGDVPVTVSRFFLGVMPMPAAD
ncbi:MAG: hypothetical protein QUS11_09180 [Candidatus Fermentibacter sp.]|nr:hypothetical protein [Candidatus Fermentibacter sp.]